MDGLDQFDDLAPYAAFLPDPIDPAPGEAVEFDGRNSWDFMGSIESYEWEFREDPGDEPFATDSGPVVSRSFDPGTYQVRLVLTDDDGNRGTDEFKLRVTPTRIDHAVAVFEIDDDVDGELVGYGFRSRFDEMPDRSGTTGVQAPTHAVFPTDMKGVAISQVEWSAYGSYWPDGGDRVRIPTDTWRDRRIEITDGEEGPVAEAFAQNTDDEMVKVGYWEAPTDDRFTQFDFMTEPQWHDDLNLVADGERRELGETVIEWVELDDGTRHEPAEVLSFVVDNFANNYDVSQYARIDVESDDDGTIHLRHLIVDPETFPIRR